MGMPIRIEVRDAHVDPAALDRAFAWFRWVDATFSTYKPDSVISRLNRGELPLSEAHPEVRAVLERCAELQQETDGYFDIHSAMLRQWERLGDAALRLGAVEPAGLVKGWAVDRAARILDAAGAENYSIDAGGDIRVRGGPAPGRPWRVGIQHPLQRDKVAAVVAATDLAIATSGAYERGDHIIDPHSGQPPQRSPLRDDRRPGPGHGRRLRHGGLRDGAGGAGMDGASRERWLRGHDDPERSDRALHARVPVALTV